MSEHRQLTLPESSSKGTAVSRGRRGAGDAKAPLKPGGDDVSVTTPPRGREALQLGFHRPARGCGPHCRGRPGRRLGTGEAPDSVTPPRDAGRVGQLQRGALRCSRGRRVPHEQTLGMGCVGALTPAVTRASDAGHMPPSDTPPPTAAVPVGGAPGGKGKRDVFFWDQKTTLQREAQSENVTVDSTVELSKLKGNPGCAHGPRPRAQEKPWHTRGAAAAGARYTYRVTLAV